MKKIKLKGGFQGKAYCIYKPYHIEAGCPYKGCGRAYARTERLAKDMPPEIRAYKCSAGHTFHVRDE